MTEATLTLVTLAVADQLCGIPVRDVRDVLPAQAVTRIPLAPPEIAGSLNLRGRIVTALDVRRRLRLPASQLAVAGMSLVTEHRGDLYALLVDSVREVITVPAGSIEPVPPTLPAAWARHSTGVLQLPDGLLVTLDIAALLDL